MKIQADWLAAPDIRAVFDLLGPAPNDVRINGGAVRDAILGESIGDIDFATRHLPQEVMARAEAAGLRTVPTGLDHGTVTVLVGKRPFEITTLREDIDTDGRRAVVAFGTDWQRDAERRDFTMNALYLEADGTIFDPLGGLQDCLDRRLRFVGDATRRIREDYLRILRFFRFAARFQPTDYDTAAMTAIAAEANGLTQISRERIGAELRKLITSRYAAAALAAMQTSGVATAIEPRGYWDVALVAAMLSLGAEVDVKLDPALLLACLLLPHGTTAGGAARTKSPPDWLKTSLRLTNGEIAQISALLQPLQLGRLPEAVAARELRHFAGPEAASAQLLWSMASAGLESQKSPLWRAALDIARQDPAPVFPLKGQDLIARGLQRGPAIGGALEKLTRLWLEQNYVLSENDIAAILSTEH